MDMKKIIVIALAVLSAVSASAQTKWKATVDSLVLNAPNYNEYNEVRRELFRLLPVGPSDIVFLGDSITDRCEIADLFGGCNIKNRGISGDRVRWMFDRYDIIARGKPAKLFILAGINDLRSKTRSRDVCFMLSELIVRFRRISPDTKIYLQSILPMNLDKPQQEKYRGTTINQRIDNCNAWLEKWCAGNKVTYINVADALKGPDGQFNENYTIDGLHPNALGYLVWKDVIETYVLE